MHAVVVTATAIAFAGWLQPHRIGFCRVRMVHRVVRTVSLPPGRPQIILPEETCLYQHPNMLVSSSSCLLVHAGFSIPDARCDPFSLIFVGCSSGRSPIVHCAFNQPCLRQPRHTSPAIHYAVPIRRMLSGFIGRYPEATLLCIGSHPREGPTKYRSPFRISLFNSPALNVKCPPGLVPVESSKARVIKGHARKNTFTEL